MTCHILYTENFMTAMTDQLRFAYLFYIILYLYKFLVTTVTDITSFFNSPQLDVGLFIERRLHYGQFRSIKKK